jgi:hypothetical protein
MKDDELEMWQRQWLAQPPVSIDLIRKVERQTVYMRLDWMAQIAPALVGLGTVVAAIMMRSWTWILLACGIWVFIIIGWRFMIQNTKGVWAPVSETTAAYLDLSVERCRRKLVNFRFGMAFAMLLTIFVMVVDYQILASAGVLRTRADYMTVAGAFLFTMAITFCVMLIQAGKRKKAAAELEYLLDLQRKLRNGGL